MTEQLNPHELDEAGVLLDVVAAIDYLSIHHRLGLTVWEALEEAVRWWTADRPTRPADLPEAVVTDLPWDDPDPLRSTIERLLGAAAPPGVTDGAPLSTILTSALDVWVARMAVLFNDGQGFAHPTARRGWPAIATTVQP